MTIYDIGILHCIIREIKQDIINIDIINVISSCYPNQIIDNGIMSIRKDEIYNIKKVT